MAFPSYTYTFTNGSTADAGQVNQNFSDILNGISDTTKSISVSAITAAGTTTLNGAVSLGQSTSSDLSFNGSIASNIPIKTNSAFDFGAATLGLKSLYIGGTSTFTTRIFGAATSSWTLTLPTTAGTGGLFLQTDGAGVTSWANVSEPLLLQTMGLAATCATNAMTVALKTLSGADPSASVPVYAAFRNATSATGQYSVISQTAALSIVIPSGASLGQTSAINQYVWVYLINDAGTMDIGVSGVSVFDDGSTVSCTQISSGATSGTALYSAGSHSGAKAVRLVGRILVNQSAAGTWASNPAEITLQPVPRYNATELVGYTPTWAGFGTVTGAGVFSNREGSYLNVIAVWINGTTTGVAATITPGFNGTNSNVNVADTTYGTNVVTGQYSGSGSQQAGAMLVLSGSPGLVGFSPVYAAAASGHTNALGNAIASTGGIFTCHFRVRIAGWSAYGP